MSTGRQVGRERRVTITVAIPLSIMAKLDEEGDRSNESISAVIVRRLKQSLSSNDRRA